MTIRNPWQNRWYATLQNYNGEINPGDKYLFVDEAQEIYVSYLNFDEALQAVEEALKNGGNINDFKVIDENDIPIHFTL